MPHITKHAPGSFSWVELSTTNQSAAKTFYSSLFGWAISDQPMGPNEVYTMFQLEGRDVGAACTSRPEERAQGVPPHWNLYVAVDSADDSANLAAKLGGTVLAPAFDVMDVGRMAVIQDPTSAVILIWQAKKHIGTGITGVNGTLCWADLNTADRPRAKQFYEGLFGWKIIPGKDKDESTYLHLMNGQEYIGGILPDTHRNPTPPHWLPYFLVASVDASLEQAKQLGGAVYVPAMTVEGSLRYAVMADPQGAVFALFERT